MSLPTSSRPTFGFIRWYPLDLAAISISVLVGYLAVISLSPGSALRIGVTLPLVFFLPGYALTAALFPAKARPARDVATSGVNLRPGGIDAVERLGLSIAVSMAIVPIVAIALAPTEWGLAMEPTAGALAVCTIVLAQIGVIRRLQIPKSDRFRIDTAGTIAWLRGEEDSTLATASSLILIVAISVAFLALTVAFVAPQPTEGFTQISIQAEDENGELVGGNFTSELEHGESVPVVLSIENHEQRNMEYTVIIQQSVENDSGVERTELHEEQVSLLDGEQIALEKDITPTAENEPVRLSVLLFEGDAPDSPTRSVADQDVYFWVNMTEEETDEEAVPFE